MLWAKVLVGNHMPRWWLDVATAIHFYEAVLATLAIIVWHFYQVFFDPDVYPMNWAWWDGKMTLHHYRDEHGLDTTMIAKPSDEPRSNAEVSRSRSRRTPKSPESTMDTEKTPPLPAEPWHRSRMLLRNPISLAGMALAIVSLANIFLFVLIDADRHQAQPLHRHSGLHGFAGIPDSWLAADAGRRAAGTAEESRAHAPSIPASI